MVRTETVSRDLSTAEALAREAAEAAFDVGGPTPYAHVEGAAACLLPTDPLEGDWAALAEALGRVPDNPVARAFRDSFRERMAELVPDRSDREAVEATWRRRRGGAR